ncbi:hypothetical protein [Brevibacterium moorei]|uniref:hypothetical protein n=1 Tax=Brevibacterium moorei TaxID=2968457 RepID=UPI00211CF1FD|nr:hypothetical protein [Brevibacterium sp. 68QC2CO]MCQ9384417.1 hypothetical protein [Brevibacterium sp. 68QC2CO]
MALIDTPNGKQIMAEDPHGNLIPIPPPNNPRGYTLKEASALIGGVPTRWIRDTIDRVETGQEPFQLDGKRKYVTRATLEELLSDACWIVRYL